MKKALKVSYVIIYIVGFFFIFMAFGSFAEEGWSASEKLVGFLMQCIQGTLLIFLNYFLRTKRLILGILFLILGVIAFFFYRMVTADEIQWGIIFTIFVPLVTIGIINIFDGAKNNVNSTIENL